ncbi:MAG TPA: hypothetical protein VFY17_05435, partial [Pilimelia sp.]|nr:hypothetical protein [Pilimelia sp.]
GVLMGGLFGLVGHSLTGGTRDFRSVAGLRAQSYDVVVDAEVAGRAAQLLQELRQTGGRVR